MINKLTSFKFLLSFFVFILLGTIIVFGDSCSKKSNEQYLQVNTITKNYGVICLQSKQFLVSIYPPNGNNKIYSGNKIISQFIDESGNTLCKTKFYTESELISENKYIYNNF